MKFLKYRKLYLLQSIVFFFLIINQNCQEINNKTLYNVTNPDDKEQIFTISNSLYGETHLFFRKQFNSFTNQSEPYQKGMTFVSDRYCPNITFGNEYALYSLKQIYSIGVEWVSIVVTEYQSTTSSYDIHPQYDPIYLEYYTHLTATISNLTFIINAAHRIGLKVMLKPHIDLLTDKNGLWRGDIQINDKDLDKWFRSYTKMISKYAALAESTNVELFSIATELQSMTHLTEQWRKVIKNIKGIYSGKLICSANYGGEETRIEFWDELDYIGIDAYYFNSVMENKTISEIMIQWDIPLDIMKNLGEKFNKSVIITEIGYCSGKCQRNEVPNNDKLQEQAKSYEALLKILEKNKDWLKGIYWWAWNSDPAFGGENDTCISPQYKPAEELIRKYWGGKEMISKPLGLNASCPCTV